MLVSALAALGLLLLYDGVTQRRASAGGFLSQVVERRLRATELPTRTLKRLAGAGSLAGVVTFLVVAGLTSSFVIAVVLGLAAACAPIGVFRSRRERRRRRFREAWPDALASLISALRSGVSLPEACASLAERGPDELKAEFDGFRSSYRATGNFASALARLRSDLADPVADRVVAALLIADEVGGPDLVRTLRALADFVREDLRVRKEIEARWSWTVTAARVAAGAPWMVLLLMSTRPEAAAAYDSSSGAVVVIAGAALTVLGYRLMLAAGRLPDDRRLRQ